MEKHFVSASCGGEGCLPCALKGRARKATHKVGEEIPHDDPSIKQGLGYRTLRHNLTAYVCCECFRSLLGSATHCPVE